MFHQTPLNKGVRACVWMIFYWKLWYSNFLVAHQPNFNILLIYATKLTPNRIISCKMADSRWMLVGVNFATPRGFNALAILTRRLRLFLVCDGDSAPFGRKSVPTLVALNNECRLMQMRFPSSKWRKYYVGDMKKNIGLNSNIWWFEMWEI